MGLPGLEPGTSSFIGEVLRNPLRRASHTEVLRGLLTPLGHGLWTAILGGVLYRTATQVQWLLIRMGRVPQPTQAQVHTFTTLNMAVLLLDALLGVAILRGRWRQALALEHAQPAPPATPPLLKAVLTSGPAPGHVALYLDGTAALTSPAPCTWSLHNSVRYAPPTEKR